MDRVKLRELAQHQADLFGRDDTWPAKVLALLDALEAADVKNTLLSACLHKAEDERDRLREDAERYRWLTKRVVITDGSTPGLMVITIVEDAIDEPNEFLDDFVDAARKE